MADINATAVGIGRFSASNGTNADVTVTIANPGLPGQTLYWDGVVYSASAAPLVAVAISVTGLVDGAYPLQVPASATAALALGFGTRPLPCNPGQNLVVRLPALGSAIVGTLAVHWHVGGV